MISLPAWMHGGAHPVVGQGRHVLLSIPGGVTVPANFSGIQNGIYPTNYGTGPASPKLPLSMSARERSHDIGGTCNMWRHLNTSSGVFDTTATARLDAWVAQCVADGREIIGTIYGTPAWAADTSINWTDQYGYQYNANPPADLTSSGSVSLAAYVTWLVNRYNGGGTRKIKYIEAWNEPLFASVTSTYFTGTYVQLARMMKAVYQAAKAADSGVTVLSPGFAGMNGGLSPMVKNLMTAAVGDGTTGKDWCDGIAFHPYDFGLVKAHPLYPLSAAMTTFLADCAAYAPGKALYNTEQGFLSNWTGVSQPDRARVIKQSALVQAAYGIKMVTWYGAASSYLSGASVSGTYVADNLIGGPLVDQTIKDAFTWVQALSGKTLYEVGALPNGGMYATTATELLVV